MTRALTEYEKSVFERITNGDNDICLIQTETKDGEEVAVIASMVASDDLAVVISPLAIIQTTEKLMEMLKQP